jgi:hypothetical protein
MTTIGFIASLSLVVAGVALLSVPAAFVVAGALTGALTVLYERGSE